VKEPAQFLREFGSNFLKELKAFLRGKCRSQTDGCEVAMALPKLLCSARWGLEDLSVVRNCCSWGVLAWRRPKTELSGMKSLEQPDLFGAGSSLRQER